MGIKEEYELYRPAYLALEAQDRGVTLYGMDAKLTAMWTRIEALEAADSEQRIEIGRLMTENAELKAVDLATNKRLDESARKFLALFKQVQENEAKVDGQLGN